MSETNFEALFIDGPLDGQIEKCSHRTIYANSVEKPTDIKWNKRPTQYVPLEIVEYQSHEFYVDGKSYYLMGLKEHSPLKVFQNFYYGYSDAVTTQKSYQDEIERLKTQIYRCQIDKCELNEKISNLKKEIADLLIGDEE